MSVLANILGWLLRTALICQSTCLSVDAPCTSRVFKPLPSMLQSFVTLCRYHPSCSKPQRFLSSRYLRKTGHRDVKLVGSTVKTITVGHILGSVDLICIKLESTHLCLDFLSSPRIITTTKLSTLCTSPDTVVILQGTRSTRANQFPFVISVAQFASNRSLC